MRKERLVVSQSLTGRLWLLHPEGRRHEYMEVCESADFPDKRSASAHLRAQRRRHARLVGTPISIPGISELGRRLASKL